MNTFIKAVVGYDLLQANSKLFLKAITILLILVTILGISKQAYRIDASAGLIAIIAICMTGYFLLSKKNLGAFYTILLVIPTVISLFFFEYSGFGSWFYGIAAAMLILIISLWKEYRYELTICLLLFLTPMISLLNSI